MSPRDWVRAERPIPQSESSLKHISLSGDPDYRHWLYDLELFRACCRCLPPCVGPGCKEMAEVFSECWSIIVEGEELVRFARSPRILEDMRDDASQAYLVRFLVPR